MFSMWGKRREFEVEFEEKVKETSSVMDKIISISSIVIEAESDEKAVLQVCEYVQEKNDRVAIAIKKAGDNIEYMQLLTVLAETLIESVNECITMTEESKYGKRKSNSVLEIINLQDELLESLEGTFSVARGEEEEICEEN